MMGAHDSIAATAVHAIDDKKTQDNTVEDARKNKTRRAVDMMTQREIKMSKA